VRLREHREAICASRRRAAHVSDHIQGVGPESVKEFANRPILARKPSLCRHAATRSSLSHGPKPQKWAGSSRSRSRMGGRSWSNLGGRPLRKVVSGLDETLSPGPASPSSPPTCRSSSLPRLVGQIMLRTGSKRAGGKSRGRRRWLSLVALPTDSSRTGSIPGPHLGRVCLAEPDGSRLLSRSDVSYPRVVATLLDLPHPKGRATHPPA